MAGAIRRDGAGNRFAIGVVGVVRSARGTLRCGVALAAHARASRWTIPADCRRMASAVHGHIARLRHTCWVGAVPVGTVLT